MTMPTRIWADLGRYTPHQRMYATEYIHRDVIARSLDRYDVIPETELTDYGKGARDAIHGVRQDLGLCEEAMPDD